MLDWREALAQALDSIRSHFARVVASSMGVFGGAAAIVLLLSYGVGFREFTRTEFARFGRGLVLVVPAFTSSGYAGYRAGLPVRIARRDLASAERSPGIDAVLPEQTYDARLRVAAEGRALRLDVSGTDHRYGAYRGFRMQHGRFFDARDVDRGRSAAVLGNEAAVELFGSAADAPGRSIRIAGRSFEVIGVAARKGMQYYNTARPDDRLVMIPVTAAEARLGSDPEAVSRVLLFPRPGVDAESALRALTAAIGPASRFDPRDLDALRWFDTTSVDRIAERFYTGFMLFIALAGLVTLMIAGVGIANYQLAVLEERVVEIGVAKALGARNRTLMCESLLESALVSGGSALLGAGLGWAAVQLLQLVGRGASHPTPQLSPLILAITFAALVATALASVVLPALRVRSIDVGVALRGGC